MSSVAQRVIFNRIAWADDFCVSSPRIDRTMFSWTSTGMLVESIHMISLVLPVQEKLMARLVLNLTTLSSKEGQ
jgi:hypothetical protein